MLYILLMMNKISIKTNCKLLGPLAWGPVRRAKFLPFKNHVCALEHHLDNLIYTYIIH